MVIELHDVLDPYLIGERLTDVLQRDRRGDEDPALRPMVVDLRDDEVGSVDQ